MALQMSYESIYGITLPKAYIRIDELSGGKGSLNLRVRSYVDALKCHEGKPWIAEDIHSFSPSVEDTADNFLKQGYEHLKTLPEYADAVDVFE